MTAKPTILLSPSGSRDRNGRIEPALVGGVITVPGKYGPAWQVAEATTNLSVRPKPHIPMYVTPGQTGVIVEDERSPSGLAMEVTVGFTGSSIGSTTSSYSQSLTPGTYTNSVYMWSDTPDLFADVYTRGFFRYSDNSTGQIVNSKKQRLTTEPQRFVYTGTSGENLTSIEMYMYLDCLEAGAKYRIAAHQIEAKPYATPYADGDLGAGHTWGGTPNASKSTRSGAMISTTASGRVDQHSGAWVMRVRRDGEDEYNGYMFMLGLYGNGDALYFQQTVNESVARFYSRTDAGEITYVDTRPLRLGEWETISLEWSQENMAVHFGTGDSYSSARTELTGALYDRISTSYNELQPINGLHESVFVFDEPLSDEQRSRLLSAERTWHWSMFEAPMPAAKYLSGASSFETEIYVTDRDNVARVNISDAVTGLGVDADVDRSGSKFAGKLQTHRAALEDGQWIAPYQTIVPETGDILRRQMGHFKISTPSNEFNGSDMVRQESSGGDIVDDLARAILPETFYTPIGGVVMEDVRIAIKLATAGVLGPNLLINGGFESGMASWSTPNFELGATGAVETVIPQYPAPEGKQLYAVFLANAIPETSRVFTRQHVLFPAGASLIMASGLGWKFYDDERLEMRVVFTDASGVAMTNQSVGWDTGVPSQRFVRKALFLAVPEGAAGAWVYLWIHRKSVAASSRSAFDDIQLRTFTNWPLPDSRINLPPSTAIATSRMQTTAGKSYAYDAINPRLAAIGHTAIHTKMDGTLTTRPSRDSQSDTAARVYAEGDYRFVNSIAIERSATNRYNHVVAIKEDMQDPTKSMAVNVYNEDRDDPWSIYGEMGLVSAPTLVVQDAVDEAALTTQALAVLGRASMQEELTIRVLPDPDLAVFDVIEITGGPEAAQGRWSVESIEWGMSVSDPTVQVGARRTVRGGS